MPVAGVALNHLQVRRSIAARLTDVQYLQPPVPTRQTKPWR